MKVISFIFLTLCCFSSNAQNDIYFPDRNVWEEKSASSFGFNQQMLDQAIDSIIANEYVGPVDLRQAILKGFEREPYHKILGPTKRRGGPAGMILKDGYIIAQWGDCLLYTSPSPRD